MRELVEIFAVLDLSDPAAEFEALVTGRILNDSVKGDVVAYDDLSHSVLLASRLVVRAICSRVCAT